MKHRLLAGILSLAAVTAMAVSFAACSPADGGDEDNGVTTEEQWVQAFADFRSADSYALKAEMTWSGGQVMTDAKVDYVNNAVYGVGAMESAGVVTTESEVYYTFSDNTITQYENIVQQDGTKKWISGPVNPYWTDLTAEQQFRNIALGNTLFDLRMVLSVTTEDGETVTGAIEDLYSLFTLDGDNTFKGTVTITTLSQQLWDVTVLFKDGKPAKVTLEGTSEGGTSTATMVTEISDYGNVTVTLPEEVKAA